MTPLIGCLKLRAVCRAHAMPAACLTETHVTSATVTRHSAAMLQADTAASSVRSSDDRGTSRELSSGVVSMAGSADRLTNSAPGACKEAIYTFRTCAVICRTPRTSREQRAACLCPCACACICIRAAATGCQACCDSQPSNGDGVSWPQCEQCIAGGRACSSTDLVHSTRRILQAGNPNSFACRQPAGAVLHASAHPLTCTCSSRACFCSFMAVRRPMTAASLCPGDNGTPAAWLPPMQLLPADASTTPAGARDLGQPSSDPSRRGLFAGAGCSAAALATPLSFSAMLRGRLHVPEAPLPGATHTTDSLVS